MTMTLQLPSPRWEPTDSIPPLIRHLLATTAAQQNGRDIASHGGPRTAPAILLRRELHHHARDLQVTAGGVARLLRSAAEEPARLELAAAALRFPSRYAFMQWAAKIVIPFELPEVSAHVANKGGELELWLEWGDDVDVASTTTLYAGWLFGELLPKGSGRSLSRLTHHADGLRVRLGPAASPFGRRGTTKQRARAQAALLAELEAQHLARTLFLHGIAAVCSALAISGDHTSLAENLLLALERDAGATSCSFQVASAGGPRAIATRGEENPSASFHLTDESRLLASVDVGGGQAAAVCRALWPAISACYIRLQAAAEEDPRFAGLSEPQARLLSMVLTTDPVKVIAGRLGCSHSSARDSIKELCVHFDVSTRRALERKVAGRARLVCWPPTEHVPVVAGVPETTRAAPWQPPPFDEANWAVDLLEARATAAWSHQRGQHLVAQLAAVAASATSRQALQVQLASALGETPAARSPAEPAAARDPGLLPYARTVEPLLRATLGCLQSDPEAEMFAALTPPQREVMELADRGCTVLQIARETRRKPTMVGRHLAAARKKLGRVQPAGPRGA